MFLERDTFLWLKRPTIANIKAVLEWAQKHALREEDIRYKERGGVEASPSDREFADILRYVDRSAKLFFRIVVRKGMNKLMRLDDKKQNDIIDICLFSVSIGEKKYYMNFYLSAGLLMALKQKFPLGEEII